MGSSRRQGGRRLIKTERLNGPKFDSGSQPEQSFYRPVFFAFVSLQNICLMPELDSDVGL